MGVNEKLKELKDILSKAKIYIHALNVICFDVDTICPKDALENEYNTIEYFSNELFKMLNNDKVNKLVVELYNEKDKLDKYDRLLIEKKYEEYLKSKNITPEFDLKRNKVYSESRMNWLKAKENKDYNIFKDSFKAVIDIQKEEIALRDNKLDSLYDNMLNDCEKGLLQEDLDVFFKELKEGLIDLINKIKNSKKVIREDFLTRRVPIYKQEKFSNYLLELNGFNLNRGVLSTTEHPFTSEISEFDSRVTTHYYEDNVLSNIYSVVHEGGHAIFMQNEPKEDHDHFINDYITNGMHESVSRFYENVIGRSKEYVHLIYPKFIETFDEFKDVSEKELYEAINIVKPSLIRTEADEVTYGLHIIIRYELEKMISNNEIAIEDVPNKWNELYYEYLGVKPSNDSEGVLQDVHWSGGFGYFPSYAIGNCYNAMYVKELNKVIDFKKAILNGDFKSINNWMIENVFKEANHLTPKEWIKNITNKSLTAKDFIEYLNDKYKEIYEF